MASESRTAASIVARDVTPTGFEQPVNETLPSIVARIVDALAPERVILFGSYAYGAPNVDSDVDLLVIMNTLASPAERFLAVSRLVRPRPFPLDVIVKTPAEIQAAAADGDPFLMEILQRGQTLYERPQ
jgi:predicted nucleotidyltransferase